MRRDAAGVIDNGLATTDAASEPGSSSSSSTAAMGDAAALVASVLDKVAGTGELQGSMCYTPGSVPPIKPAATAQPT